MISTEALLTDRAGFGIVSASPAQRAICRILDGQPLGDLAAHPDVLELVGGDEALSALPSERGVMPTEVCVLAAIRSAKTIIACAAAIRMTQSVDLSKLGPGEVPRVSIVSLKLDTSAVAHRILAETLRASPLLAALLLDDTNETITVRHPSGRPVEIAVVAGSRAGAGLVARWSAGIVFDEAPRMTGADDAVVNLEHARSAILGRLLPGAQALYIGSPWAPHGPIYDMVAEHWTKPSDNVVVLRGTGPMLNPQWWTPARCAKLEKQDPIAYQTDVLGEFADPESGLLNPSAVHRNTRSAPLELAPNPRGTYAAAVDPSEGGAGSNGWTLVIVEVIAAQRLGREESDELATFRVAVAREWRGMRPEELWREVSALCTRYGIDSAWSDQYAASANQDLARRYGLHLRIDKTSASSKLEMFTNLQTRVHADGVELPPDRQFVRDLLSIRKRTTQTGSTIVLPKTGDGRHADFAPALALALSHAATIAKHGDARVIITGGRYSDDVTLGGSRHSERHEGPDAMMKATLRRARSVAALNLLRSTLRLHFNAPVAEIAEAIEARLNTDDDAAIDALLARITGRPTRADALAVLRAGQSTQPPTAA